MRSLLFLVSVCSSTFTSSLDGFPLQYRAWSPTRSPRATLYIVHGMAEHGGRYEAFGKDLADLIGIKVFAHDQRAHGQTACKANMCNLGIFETLKSDLRENPIQLMAQDVLDLIEATADPSLPVFVLGHSMGSVVARAMLQRGVKLRGMILSGVPTAPTSLESYVFPLIGATIKLGRGFGHELVQNVLITGKFDAAFPGSTLKNRFVSSDPAAVEEYNADPFCGHLVDVDILLSVGSTLTELQGDSFFKTSRTNSLPLLFIAGRKDPVCNFGLTATADAARMARLGHPVTEVFLGNARHEFINEPYETREQGLRIVANWMESLIQKNV